MTLRNETVLTPSPTSESVGDEAGKESGESEMGKGIEVEESMRIEGSMGASRASMGRRRVSVTGNNGTG